MIFLFFSDIYGIQAFFVGGAIYAGLKGSVIGHVLFSPSPWGNTIMPTPIQPSCTQKCTWICPQPNGGVSATVPVYGNEAFLMQSQCMQKCDWICL